MKRWRRPSACRARAHGPHRSRARPSSTSPATRRPSSPVSGDGLLTVFVPHATAGLAVLELGSGSDDDLLAALGRLLPVDGRLPARARLRGHGRSHVMPAFVAPSVVVPVVDGRLALGTWQSLALVDLNVDNPRARSG